MNNYICNQIENLLSAYMDNELDAQEHEFVKNHLNECRSCYQKYQHLSEVLHNLRDSYQKVAASNNSYFNIREYEFFIDNASAYIDKELNLNDKKLFVNCLNNSTLAQKKFIELYKVKKVLKNRFSEVESGCKKDFSKAIIKRIKNEDKVINFPIRINQRVAMALGFIMILTMSIFPPYKKVKEHSDAVIRKEMKTVIVNPKTKKPPKIKTTKTTTPKK